MTTTPPDAPAGPPPADHGADGSVPGPQGPQGPRATREELRDLGRIRRTTGPDRKVAGVAGGLARHLDIDPIILRVAFVVLVFFGGAGLLLYGACWLLLPEDGSAGAPLSLDDRNRSIALVVVGAISALLVLGDSIGPFGFPWPLAVVALVALLVLVYVDRDRKPRPTAPPVPHVPEPGTGAFTPAAPGTPVPVATTYLPRPRNPRRRGPILFWFTLALAALGLGVLGILDLAGAPIADPAYPALVVGICGVMLLVGAFYGRAGGLIFIGLVAALALSLATITQRVDGADITRRPLTAADVPSSLDTSAGEIILDLTDVSDLAALDGKHIELDADIGRIEVIVPAGLSVRADANVDGPGHVQLFGDERGGIGVGDEVNHVAGVGAPEISIDADISIGEIEIHEGAF
jgi:phage shock protein PspC (stress-responsive transcriptional regulator)